MRHHRIRRAAAVAALAFAAAPAAAQSRGAQLTAGLSLASLGAYAAFADRYCRGDLTVSRNGWCEWRTVGGRHHGSPSELDRRQMAAGLAVAGVGGLMAGGVWKPSRAVDALVAAGAGVLLMSAARNENFRPGTVHIRTDDDLWLTSCTLPDGVGFTADYEPLYGPPPECRHTSFDRLHAAWAGVAALGLAAGRWLWRDQPKLNVEARPGAVAVRATVAF